MTFELEVSHRAESFIDRASPELRRRILARLVELAEHPLDARHSKPLRDPLGRRASRVGDFRIIYSVDRDRRIVLVSEIASRGEVYRRL